MCVFELGIYLEREKKRIYKKRRSLMSSSSFGKKEEELLKRKQKKNADDQMFLSLTSLIHGSAQLEKVKQLFSVISNLS
jgi:ATP-dependent helicase/DNAse subunit B